MVITTDRIIIFLVLVIGLALLAGTMYRPLDPMGAPKEITIEPGNGATTIAQKLQDGGVIRSRYLFILYATFFDVERVLQAGTYEFSPQDNIPKIVTDIAKGRAKSTDILVRIPEGLNVWNIEEVLVNKGISQPGEFVQKALRYEGYLFPDTYRFKKDATVEDVILTLRRTFKEKMREAGLNPTPDQVIVASMLEKEVFLQTDRRMVADIIARRIKIGQKLQLDATVIYNVCWVDQTTNCSVGKIPVRPNLFKEGPYNTYVIDSLPQGPISNPGIRSIQAAIDPLPNPYFFYLNAIYSDGRTIYSRTGVEHERQRAIHILR
ncbi:MAG: hypothetical protein COV31_02850 [Candidatus Yanofskybacteria bacterium CG10_big_fil_rev_8_21_14_0_10_46_23]|uniref:Endolytic murein transglycosylase n=1 Tax=Candidatus Yanofskybacteria bacterium CG10_big_fil_rev_8_21_14_0_10_46_23 TaxID=1975098 RepID=A0A2H0R3S2_9BACT|nr:MAG: hypothetical protein COV31_02850 [Candidatus Yanofskybacteria bacterium CG10_big_fil_rev_8_21_14_0_10_46_23]